jgi:hypothetical protein
MRCPTCGESLHPDASRCPTCGAAVTAVVESSVGLHRCPRCGYTGQGVQYFTRPGHVALLVGVSIFTYGLGGLVYWLARRKHSICPSCGLAWERSGFQLPAVKPFQRLGRPAQQTIEEPLPSGGVKRRVLGTLLVMLACVGIVMGIVELEVGAIIGGSFLGALGTVTLFSGWKATQERRQAVMARYQRRVLRLATEHGGTLTVTEVASELNLAIPAAEKVLVAMDDGYHVRSDITPEGILIYEFPEVQHRSRLEPGKGLG